MTGGRIQRAASRCPAAAFLYKHVKMCYNLKAALHNFAIVRQRIFCSSDSSQNPKYKKHSSVFLEPFVSQNLSLHCLAELCAAALKPRNRGPLYDIRT